MDRFQRTRESFDDKVVDLCAALECMLATKSDKSKGAALAFRYYLLSLAMGGLVERPFAVFDLYEMRSDIVHGSKRHIATEWDYALLREIADAAFSKALRFVAANPDLKSIKALIDQLEADEHHVKIAVANFANGSKSSQAVAAYGKLVLGPAPESMNEPEYPP